ncbi:MAG: Gfo/Idh/MocA family oxidoreductase [Paracoccaceae bacterium]|nr:Gfo/Idh/MocA family oxidoreductase [Paracoccaceae bacterium]
MKKIRWGIVGGGEGSQIGFAHRAGVAVEEKYDFVASALDIDPAKAKEFGIRLGVSPDRAYGNWQEMLQSERARPDRIELVTVATPNDTHFEICKSFMEAGIDVFCEKPLTINVEEAMELVKLGKKLGRVCAVNFGYTGYPMIRQMREMVLRGDLGKTRVVFTQFAGGFMAESNWQDDPRIGWRFDPKKAGVSAVTLDLGSHAMHLACFVTGQKVKRVSSDFAVGVAGRELEDDSLTAFRLQDGTIGRQWVSGLAYGRIHGLSIQIFGELGGLRWQQEQPNQLYWTKGKEATKILERGAPYLYDEANRAGRVTIGHPEGMPLAFSTLYKDLAEVINCRKEGKTPDQSALTYPSFEDGLHMVEVVFSQVDSSRKGGQWTEVPDWDN